MVVRHLKQIGKVKEFNSVPHELPENKKKSFWSVVFFYSTQQQQIISWLDCDVRQKVDFIWQPAMTSSVVGPRRSSKSLTKAKHAPKKGHGHHLVVCCWSDTLQLSESQQNHYIWEVRSANQWDALKTAMPAAGIGQQNGPSSSSRQCLTAEHVAQATLQKLNRLGHNFWLICHFHLTSSELTATSSSISTTFCRENASTISRIQKMLSKSPSDPEAWIFTLQE